MDQEKRLEKSANGRHFGDFVPTLPTFWRFCADIADMLVILCRHCELLCVYCLFMVCCEISSVYSVATKSGTEAVQRPPVRIWNHLGKFPVRM